MDEHTRSLAAFAANLRFDDLPRPVVEHAKVCLLDALGVGLFGSTRPWPRIAADSLLEVEGSGPCTLWGMTRKVSPTGAALVNGTSAHSFELDDLHRVSIVHMGPVIPTSAIAVAEQLGGVSGERLVTALVAGNEVAARVGSTVGMAHLVAGFQPTGTHGTTGAAAAAGSLLGLSPDQMHHAIGIAGAQAAGLMASQYGSMVKRLIPGRAAQTGTFAAYLARRGFTGIKQLLEAEYGGYCATLSRAHHIERATEGLGETWETLSIGFKPYSTNASCHVVIDALLELKALHGFGPDDLESVQVYSTTATYQHVGWPYVPDSVTTAQMNVLYIAAVTITDGDAFVDQFTEERIRDPRLVELSKRIKVIPDPELDALGDDHRHHIRIEVALKDGRVFRDERHNAKGSPGRPLTLDEIEHKYARLAGKVLPAEQVSQLRSLVYQLDKLEDIGVLARALVPPSA